MYSWRVRSITLNGIHTGDETCIFRAFTEIRLIPIWLPLVQAGEFNSPVSYMLFSLIGRSLLVIFAVVLQRSKGAAFSMHIFLITMYNLTFFTY